MSITRVNPVYAPAELASKVYYDAQSTALEARSGDTVYRLQIQTNGYLRLYKSTNGGSSWTNQNICFTGHTHAPSDITNLGTTYTASKGSLSLAANQDAYTLGASVTLPAGTYVIQGQFAFSSTSGTASSTTIELGTSSSSYGSSRMRVHGTDSWWSCLTTSMILSLSAQTTVYVRGSCSVARSDCNSSIAAVRIK